MKFRAPLLPGWVRWAAVIVVGAFIFYVSIVTVPPETPVDQARPLPELIPLDKWRHFVAYAVFGGLLAYATTDWDLDARILAVLVISTTVVYGVGIEFWQSLIPAGYFSVGDAWANAIGGLLVVPWYLAQPYLEFVPVQSLLSD